MACSFLLRLGCGCIVFADDLVDAARGSSIRRDCVLHGRVELVAVLPGDGLTANDPAPSPPISESGRQPPR